MNCFEKQLQVGKRAEVAVKRHLEQRGHTVTDVSENQEYQKKDIDFIVSDANRKTTLEVKRDNNFSRTGNLLFEEYNRYPSFTNPGWLQYCEAKYMCYYDTNKRKGVIIDYPLACSLLGQYGRRREVYMGQECKYIGIILLPIGIARQNNAIVYEWEE